MRHRYRLISSSFPEVLEAWIDPEHLPGVSSVLPCKPAVSTTNLKNLPAAEFSYKEQVFNLKSFRVPY